MTDYKPEFMDIARFIIAPTVIIGGGSMVWFGKATAETIWTVTGVVLGFYFGTASAGAMARAVDAVTRQIQGRG